MKILLVVVLLVILTSRHSIICYRLRDLPSSTKSFNLPKYSDRCDYNYPDSPGQYLCGDVCLDQVSVLRGERWGERDICDCGGQKINFWDFQYCCASASACIRTNTGVECSSGEVLSLNSSVICNATGRCFNDVITSQHYTLHYAKYTCHDKCIDWRDMCQGLLCAGDEEACGPEIRCPVGGVRYTPQYNMSTNPIRSYCYDF